MSFVTHTWANPKFWGTISILHSFEIHPESTLSWQCHKNVRICSGLEILRVELTEWALNLIYPSLTHAKAVPHSKIRNIPPDTSCNEKQDVMRWFIIPCLSKRPQHAGSVLYSSAADFRGTEFYSVFCCNKMSCLLPKTKKWGGEASRQVLRAFPHKSNICAYCSSRLKKLERRRENSKLHSAFCGMENTARLLQWSSFSP